MWQFLWSDKGVKHTLLGPVDQGSLPHRGQNKWIWYSCLLTEVEPALKTCFNQKESQELSLDMCQFITYEIYVIYCL
jgi:hypothetical protein